MADLPPVFWVCVAVLCVTAGLTDLKTRRIPNWLTIPALTLGLLLHVLYAGTAGASAALIGIAVALLVYVPLYLLRGIGAGDLKLMAAAAALLGPVNWIALFLATCVIAGIAGLVYTVARKKLGATLLNVSTLVGELVHLRAPYRSNELLDVRRPDAMRLPHGISIAVAAILLIFLVAHGFYRP